MIGMGIELTLLATLRLPLSLEQLSALQEGDCFDYSHRLTG